ncbi:MAG TPA: adenylate/guanylate cyclase domain-containing protein [Candidatus Dormibacteraeota bacterium]|nr:adenylate/guanylate cyclase domain-containing protein [Candidatus Dormibacteraeota bacterium]
MSTLAAVLMTRAGQPALYMASVSSYAFVTWTAGLVAWRRRPENPTGRQLMAAAFLANVSIIALNSAMGPLVTVGHVIAGSSGIVLVYILLAYPWGRLANRFDRWALAVLAVLFFAVGTASVAATGTCPYCAGLDRSSLLKSAFQTADSVGYAIAIAVVLLRVFRRYVVASPPARRLLTPVLFGGVIATLLIGWREIGPEVFGSRAYTPLALSASDAAQALIPIGLLIGFLRLRLERASVGALAADLTLGGAVRDQLQDVLARRLGDPTLQVAFWSPEAEAYTDRDGVVVDLASMHLTRAFHFLDRDGSPDIAIVCDAALAEDPGLLGQVGAVVHLAVANISARLPAGEVTFLSTDIVKSTELLGRLRERYGPVLSEHRQLLRQEVARHSGYVVDSRADEFFAVFTQPLAAVGAAVNAQRELGDERWVRSLGLKVRMGIHSGRPELHDGAYVGIDVHHAIRVSASAQGGQILLSESTRLALGETGFAITPHGEQQLKGFPAPEMLYELQWQAAENETNAGLVGVSNPSP